MQPYIKDDLEVEIGPDFEQKREKGENEEIFSQMIRVDLITEFIVYVNRNELLQNSVINESPYETNNFLLGKNPSLIKYSAFYGSFQAIKCHHNDIVNYIATNILHYELEIDEVIVISSINYYN